MGKARRTTPTMGRGGATSAAPRAVAGLRQVPGLLSNPLFACAVLALLAALVYANALPNQFVFDDYGLVVDNPQIRSLAKIPDFVVIAELFLIEELFIHNPVKKAERNGQRYPYDAGRPNPDRTCAREFDAARFSRTFSPGGRGY